MSDCTGCDHPEKYGHNAYCPESRIDELKARLAEANAKMMLLHNESISLHTRLAEATGIINQRALELADTQGQLTEAKRYAARYLWLRDRAWPFEFKGDTPEDADAAIDKAIAQDAAP
jgi:hypothetical protein